MKPTSSEEAEKAEGSIEIKDEIKDEPDIAVLDSRSTGRRAPAPRSIKTEEPDNGPIDLTLPEADESNNIFEDVDEDGDEDEIVDLTYEGIAEVNGVSHFVCEGFQIPQIPEPLIVKRKLIELFNCIEAKSIFLEPNYQREVVWDEARAGLLITSILMGYFVPPIIFNVKKTVVKVEGREQVKILRVCVDGKQRLTSIWKFMRGEIGFFDSGKTQRKWYYCHQLVSDEVQVSNRNILPNAVKKFFDERFFCTYEYDELDIETEENMFQLVQRGVALTPAEKMRALSSEWAVFTKQYEDDYELIVNLSKQNRASGFRLVLTIFTMIQEVMAGRRKRGAAASAAPPLQASPQALMKVLEDKEPISPILKLKYKAIFDRYEGLVRMSSSQITTTRWKVNTNSVFDPAPAYLREAGVNHVRTFSPLELVVTAILVSVHMERSTDEQLLEDIKEMRKFLRIEHKDLRVNAQCWTTAWRFITEMIDKRRGFKNASGQASTGKVLDTNDLSILSSIEGGFTNALGTEDPSLRSSTSRDSSSSPLSSVPSSDDSDLSESSESSEESDGARDFPNLKITYSRPLPKATAQKKGGSSTKMAASRTVTRSGSSPNQVTNKRGRSSTAATPRPSKKSRAAL